MRLMSGLVRGPVSSALVSDGRERAVAGEAVGEAEDVVMERVQAALVALGEKLGFVGGHVDLHGALGFAGFATEAKVESLVDGVALEAFVAQGAGEHLPKKMGAAAGRVLLLAGSAIAGAHDAALRVAARAYAHAALGGAFKGARRWQQTRIPSLESLDVSSCETFWLKRRFSVGS